ncbi:tRNA (adenosine(37)-N6)-threonylcarbamoyltransferase complex dimerization subunit type 1 TsaB [Cohaesibacter sp. CAU 1516]|uniref:tRNA (adenosine(37)-N6)-threonylcarbamoyltransferase complex dimerization subunit type 1 TsaB n=1 Tax=Cohaesibacter sp. CAU 1516 TaxID=2576038 RepID=UPI0010FD2975|nr:tRNA (adenosine(37)-N6)-threonylcarbamoyltransferase complex dimerization subunit type 1 TsaB [Cohaesibacter sp. CAU 1516]TLP47202.1 tRNA (adenosine(37)-N6)-threonylcarbamoyltransferase complex dimerization subunit type 1 TsaB [Cohaesibacter sp. CAU 1516]
MTQLPEICLALDTALDACSVGLAIREGGKTRLVGRSLVLGRGHAEHLMTELGHLLADADLTYQDLTRLAVTVGPGSFTGLRVGLATARSLALALDIPLVGASTLEALALTAMPETKKPLAVLVDARRNQVYGQLFAMKAHRPHPLTEAAALSAEDFAALCIDHQVAGLIGSGAALVKEEDRQLAALPIAAATAPDMRELARWALDQPEPRTSPAPLYLRGPDAKPQAAKAIARR